MNQPIIKSIKSIKSKYQKNLSMNESINQSMNQSMNQSTNNLNYHLY